MNLFYPEKEKKIKPQVPLADRMRPETLDQFVGQEHIVGEGRILRKMIKEDKIVSIIFWGLPVQERPPWLASLPILLNHILSNFLPLPQV